MHQSLESQSSSELKLTFAVMKWTKLKIAAMKWTKASQLRFQTVHALSAPMGQASWLGSASHRVFMPYMAVYLMKFLQEICMYIVSIIAWGFSGRPYSWCLFIHSNSGWAVSVHTMPHMGLYKVTRASLHTRASCTLQLCMFSAKALRAAVPEMAPLSTAQQSLTCTQYSCWDPPWHFFLLIRCCRALWSTHTHTHIHTHFCSFVVAGRCALERKASASRTPLSTGWSRTSCCRVETSRLATAQAASPSTGPSSLTRTSNTSGCGCFECKTKTSSSFLTRTKYKWVWVLWMLNEGTS